MIIVPYRTLDPANLMCSFLSVCFRFLNRIASALVPLLIVSCPALDRRPWRRHPPASWPCVCPCVVCLASPRSHRLASPRLSPAICHMPSCVVFSCASAAPPTLSLSPCAAGVRGTYIGMHVQYIYVHTSPPACRPLAAVVFCARCRGDGRA